MKGWPAIFLALALVGPARAEPASIFGDWYTEGEASTVRLYPCGEALCGVIVGLKIPHHPDGRPILDVNNKHEALRKRPLLGLEFMKDFRPDTDTRWNGGWAYNPREGIASDDVEILRHGPDVLEVTGCILWGAICITETWTRVAARPSS